MEPELKKALAGVTLTVAQTAAVLNCSKKTVRVGIHEGWIEAIKVGSDFRVLTQPLRKRLGLQAEVA
jgi:excisionase family DNA binding protein